MIERMTERTNHRRMDEWILGCCWCVQGCY